MGAADRREIITVVSVSIHQEDAVFLRVWRVLGRFVCPIRFQRDWVLSAS
jgi:hypothetical protein